MSMWRIIITHLTCPVDVLEREQYRWMIANVPRIQRIVSAYVYQPLGKLSFDYILAKIKGLDEQDTHFVKQMATCVKFEVWTFWDEEDWKIITKFFHSDDGNDTLNEVEYTFGLDNYRND